jgi:hypothetical protein
VTRSAAGEVRGGDAMEPSPVGPHSRWRRRTAAHARYRSAAAAGRAASARDRSWRNAVRGYCRPFPSPLSIQFNSRHAIAASPNREATPAATAASAARISVDNAPVVTTRVLAQALKDSERPDLSGPDEMVSLLGTPVGRLSATTCRERDRTTDHRSEIAAIDPGLPRNGNAVRSFVTLSNGR